MIKSDKKAMIMNFNEKYKKVKNIISDDLLEFEQDIANLFGAENELSARLNTFLTAPSKRLRPLLGMLFSRAYSDSINLNQKKAILAIELIHNATLIHDDVIDDASKRRNQETINSSFDDNLAVVAGDYLLSLAMEKVIETSNLDVVKLFTSAMKNTCIGEIKQYFSKFNVTSIEDYIEKSKNKTALLFEVSVLSSMMLLDEKCSDAEFKSAKEFAINFGIAFQIRDDLINVLSSDELKPSLNDLGSGIYTAPVIYAYENDKSILEIPTLSKIEQAGGIEKAKLLMHNYFQKAQDELKILNSSPYKQALVELISILKESI